MRIDAGWPLISGTKTATLGEGPGETDADETPWMRRRRACGRRSGPRSTAAVRRVRMARHRARRAWRSLVERDVV